MYSTPDMGLAAALGGFIAGAIVVWLLLLIAVYVFMGLVNYKLFRKANVNHPWLAWIPIGHLWPLFDTVKIRRIHILWMIVPPILAMLAMAGNSGVLAFLAVLLDLVPAVLGIIIVIRLYKAFGISLWWLLLYVGILIPILDLFAGIAILVLLCYMAFCSRVVYNPNFNVKRDNSGPNIPG
jgi:hypothetical protein